MTMNVNPALALTAVLIRKGMEGRGLDPSNFADFSAYLDFLLGRGPLPAHAKRTEELAAVEHVEGRAPDTGIADSLLDSLFGPVFGADVTREGVTFGGPSAKVFRDPLAGTVFVIRNTAPEEGTEPESSYVDPDAEAASGFRSYVERDLEAMEELANAEDEAEERAYNEAEADAAIEELRADLTKLTLLRQTSVLLSTLQSLTDDDDLDELLGITANAINKWIADVA